MVTVNFDAGTLSGSTYSSQEIDINTQASRPNDPTTVPGVTFSHWALGVVTAWDFDNLIAEDITLTAVYTDSRVTVTFDAGEHGNLSGGTATQTELVPGEAITGEPTAVPDAGWTFVEWDNGYDGNVPTASTTYTAVYRDDRVTVTFFPGAHGSLSGTTVYTEQVPGTDISGAPTVTAHQGWAFVRWDNDYNGKVPTTSTSYTAVYTDKRVTITYVIGAEGVNAGTKTIGDQVPETGMPTCPDPVGKTDWAFDGWTVSPSGAVIDELPEYVPDVDTTYTAIYKPDLNNNGKPDEDEYVTITFSAGAHGRGTVQYTNQVPGTAMPATPKITAAPGWSFIGWDRLIPRLVPNASTTYTAKYSQYGIYIPPIVPPVNPPVDPPIVKDPIVEEKETPVVKPEVPVTDDGLLNKEDHYAYMRGDENGNFNPDALMTRAEAAQVFYNLLENKDVEMTVTFTDVPSGAWYETPMRTLASLKIITGYPDGTAGPNNYITRAEFVAIASRFEGLAVGSLSFPDVHSDHWALKYIVSAAVKGWINGYPDGSFKPDNNILRCEAVKTINALLGRMPDTNYIDANETSLVNFPDLSQTHWAYYEIMEATNGHEHTIQSGKEIWYTLT